MLRNLLVISSAGRRICACLCPDQKRKSILDILSRQGSIAQNWPHRCWENERRKKEIMRQELPLVQVIPVDDLRETLPLPLWGAQEDTPLLGQLKTNRNASETCSCHIAAGCTAESRKFKKENSIAFFPLFSQWANSFWEIAGKRINGMWFVGLQPPVT